MTRAELKSQAKEIISANYWQVIGTTFVSMLLYGAANGIPGCGAVAGLFVYPVIFGLMLYYVDLSEGRDAKIGDVFENGFNGKYYLRRVGGFAWELLFTFLWMLLFIVPGIVKSYSYALTSYILAKYPEVEAKEALKISMRLMDGKKAELFVLHMSFIGWGILSSLTVGLLGIFYVLPYLMITQTLWQKNVMEEAIADGKFAYNF